MSAALILEKVDAIEARLAARIEERVESVLAQSAEKISALEAKLAAAPAIVSSTSLGRKGVVAENNKRFASQLKEAMVSLKAGAPEVTVAKYESADHALVVAEASALTGGGDGKGGRTAYDPVFTSLRQMNPLRGAARMVSTEGSSYQFRTKVGNGGVTWGYSIQNNGAATTVDTRIWTQILMDVNAQFPIRTAALDDIDGLESNVVADFEAEFSEVEAYSMQQNDPSSATFNGTIFGGQSGLRGLDSYAGAAVAAYSSGADGAHTIAQVDQATLNAAANAQNIAYTDLVNVMHALPVQYWGQAEWVINRTLLGAIRNLRDNNGAPILDRNDTLARMGYVGSLLGFPVRASNYADAPSFVGAAGTASLFPLYFGNFNKGFTIVDRLGLVLRRYDQTQPGFITFYGEKRLATAVVDPFSIVRLRSSATAPAAVVPSIGPGM